MAEDNRERILRRIERLPADRLAVVQRLLDLLECGDSSPLSKALRIDESSVSTAQRRAAEIADAMALKSGDKSPHSKDWPHAPLHRIHEHGTYIVTVGTLDKEHWFRGKRRLDMLHDALLRTARQLGWQLEAWAVFSNHYHFIGHRLAGAAKLDAFAKRLHGATARAVNQLDNAAGRQIWHNYWDTQLTFEKSYLARLNYVHQNAVKHGLVPVANQYRWCSAAWLERAATPAQVKTIYSFKTDKLKIQDDYEPI